MKIIYNRILPIGKNFLAINLFGVLFAKGPCSPTVINHEKIHTAQMRELWFIFFYLWYILEWIFRSLSRLNFMEGYSNISFEREAYANASDPQYLKSRKKFSFLKYLKGK